MTSSIEPAFDHADVVSKYFEIKTGGSNACDCLNEKLETDALCPSDVMTVQLPIPDEVPCMPALTNDDCDAGATGIGESLRVVYQLRARYGDGWERDCGEG